MSRPTNPLQRVTAGLTAGLLVVSQLSFPTRAEAALGSSTASAGSALPPSMTAIESFQPDLFTGRATTSISIAVPPGRKGMQPNLALTYSSSARNGWVGVGWSLDTGYIERNTKKGVPTYTATDTFTFMLQGVASDLVQLSDGTFRAKDEGLFLRFQNNGGSGWEVRDKSGTRYLFGQTAASQIASAGQVFRWSLDKVIDVNGNNMILTYTKDQGQLYLDQIDYTGFEGTGPSPASSVKLTPESRTDVETSYRSGFSVTTAKRLQSIEAKTMVNSVLSPARRYDFEYAYSPRTGRSLLTGVTQVGTDGVTSLPATSFGYQDTDIPGYSMSANNPTTSSPGWNIRRASLDTGHENFGCVHPYSGLSWTQPEVVTGTSNFPCLSASVGSNGSVTMNGCQDNFGHAYVFVYNNSARTLSVPASPLSDVDGCVWREDASGIQNMGSGSSIPVQAGWTVLHITAYHQHQGWGIAMSTALTSQVTLMSPAQFIQPQISGDFDGNGMTDLATFTPSSGKWVVSLSQGSSFSPETTWLSSGFGNSASTPLVGDWNADGRTDIAVYDDGAWRFAMSTGSAFQENTGAFLYAYAAGKPFAGDFNGDGILDVGAYTPNTDVKWSVALGTGSNFVPTSSLNSFVGTSTTLPLTGDFNGDGLTDIAVLTQSSAEIDVQLSTGSGWTSAADWVPNPYWTGQKATTADINGDGLTDIVYYINASARVFWARSTGTHFEFVEALPPVFSDFVNSDPPQVGDFNGDGLADPAVFNATTGASELAKSQGTFPDLLSSISNGLGGTTALHYQPSSQVPSLPFVIPIVDQVTISDGLSNSYTTTYAYESGVYDASAREFRGFGRVQMRDAAGMITATSFHQDAVKKGRPFQIEVSDTMGDPWTTTEHTWNETTPYPGIDAHAVQLAETVVTDFDGDDDVFHEVRSRFEYDSYGNVTAAYEDGEIIGGVADAVNKRSAVTTYTTPNTTDWILNRPQLIQTLKANGTTVAAQRRFYYDNLALGAIPTKGNLTKEEEWRDLPSVKWLPTTLTYDAYGNVKTVTDAQTPTPRTTTNYYDATSTYLVKITNHLGHTRELTYDSRFGQVTLSKDQNLVPTTTEYDVFGRAKKVIGPNDSSSQPTIEYEYDLTTNPSRTTVKTRIQSGAPNLLTAHTFTDGLGRTIQTRAPAEDSSKQAVSGAVEFNTKGQVVKQWVSYLDSISSSYVPAPVASLASPVEYTYDPAGRVLRTTNPDGSFAETDYDDWKVTSTDANGHVTRHFNDAYGRLIKVEEVNSSSIYPTTYEYDTLNNLTKVTDQAGNITTITYDSLGRKLSMNDPDMGIWNYAYDDVDNLTSQTDRRGVVISFTYDALNRLKTKSYSSLPADVTNPGAVTYTYDQVTAQNFGKGKLTSITDGSGSSSFEYDNLGRLTKETKTIDGTPYTVNRSYDLLGRLTSLTYPDTETAAYTYNAQGGIETVALGAQPIISGMVYNAAGQVTKITYGNGVVSDYTYNPQTLRLDQLKSAGPGGILQDFTYAFDGVGNVTQVTDAVHTGSQSFTYDALHRLSQAQGAYGTLNYSYDPVGNLTNKEGVAMTYGAGAAGPHAVTGLADGTVLNYDVNGNLKQKVKGTATLATYTWDAENRLTQVAQVPPETTVQVTLQAGWNFFALPVELSLSTNVDTTSIAQVSRYTNGTWEHWVNDPEFNDFELWEMEPGVGYQVYCTDAVQLNLTGKPISGLSKSLTAGWHLLGATNATGTLTPAGWLAGITASQVKKLADSSGTLAPATQIDPGQAYWVQLGTGGTWTPPAPPQQTTTFAYDGDGGRVKQTVGSQTTTYLGETYEKTGGTTTKYVFAGEFRVAAKDSTGALRFYHTDHLGSSNVVTDVTGALVELNEQTPFGSLNRHEGTTNVAHKFTGQRLDQTGLYFYQARYYDPQLGRFLSPDPIVQDPADLQTLNRYSYVRNNPINLIDPSGYFSWKKLFLGNVFAAIAIVAAIAGVALASVGLEPAAGLAFNVAAWAAVQSYQAYSSAFRDVGRSNNIPDKDNPIAGLSPMQPTLATASPIGSSAHLTEADIIESETLQDSWGPDDVIFLFTGLGVSARAATTAVRELGPSVIFSLRSLGETGAVRLGAEEAGERGAIVMGENMDRVRRAGKMLGAKVFRGNTEAGNIRFINNARKEGRTFLDIGPDFVRRLKWLGEGRNPAGKGYSLERKLTVDYGKVIRLWQRTGKFSGTSRY